MVGKTTGSYAVCCAILGSVIGLAGVARAQVANDAFYLQLDDGVGSGTFVIPCAPCFWEEETQSFYWGIHGVLEPILDSISGEPLAYIIDVTASSALGTTWFTKIDLSLLMGNRLAAVTIRSPLLQFPTISDEYSAGRATMTLTVSDENCDSAWAAGVGTPGTGMFHAYYDGIEFADLLAQVFAGNCATATGGQNDPPVGYRDIHGTVSSIETEFTFLATPNDYIEFSGAFRLPPPPQPCIGDLDDDRDVDFQDLSLMLFHFGACNGDSGYTALADNDGSGCVDLADLSVMLGLYGVVCD
jgi:hypothetical protein